MSRRARQQNVFFYISFRRKSQNIRLASPFLTLGIWNFSFPTFSSPRPFLFYSIYLIIFFPLGRIKPNWAKSAIKPSLKMLSSLLPGGDLKLTLSYTLLGCKAMATKLSGNLLFFFFTGPVIITAPL